MTHLAVEQRVAASTQSQALSALLFLYREMLRQDVGLTIHAVRAERPRRLPIYTDPADSYRVRFEPRHRSCYNACKTIQNTQEESPLPRIPIAQLRLNTTIRQQPYLLREVALSTTRSGSYMLHVTLADRTGAIPGVLFDATAAMADNLIVGRGVEVSGRVSEYRGRLQLNLDRIVPTELVDLSEFLPVARRPLEEMEQELVELIASVENPDLSNLLHHIMDEATLRLFCRAPAAKINHHACIGGLVEHTLDIIHLVLTSCASYPELDRDLVVTAGILHDLGKIDAYDPITFDLTEEGVLWSHLYRSASRVEQAIAELPDFDPELRLRLVHAILAHHGHLEHGSPVVPMTPEAILLHKADSLDGDLRGALDHLERTPDEGSAFTERSFMHDTRLYRGSQDENPSGQSTLW